MLESAAESAAEHVGDLDLDARDGVPAKDARLGVGRDDDAPRHDGHRHLARAERRRGAHALPNERGRGERGPAERETIASGDSAA